MKDFINFSGIIFILIFTSCSLGNLSNNASGPDSQTLISTETKAVRIYSTLLPPTLVSPANGAAGIALTPYPVLTWNASSGATSYRAQISLSPTFSSLLADNKGLKSLSVAVNFNITYNTTYYWRVNASNSSNTSKWSSTRSFTTISAPIVKDVPLPPTLVSPVNGATGVSMTPYPVLTWNASSGADSYRAQISLSPAFSSLLADNAGLTGLAVVAYFNISASTTYYWRVNASNSSGTSEWSITSSFTTLSAPTVQDAPNLISPANGALVPANPTLVWSAVSGAARYHIQVATGTAFDQQFNFIEYWALTDTSYQVQGHPEQAYMSHLYWRVQAISANNAGGPWSEVRDFTITTP